LILVATGAAGARAKAAGSGTAETIGVIHPRMLRALAPARRDSAAGALAGEPEADDHPSEQAAAPEGTTEE
jgi:hypothetical protein